MALPRSRPIIETAEERRSQRYRIQLRAEAVAGDSPLPIVIHELSSSGFLVEAPAEADAQSTIEVELPGAGVVEARFVRRDSSLVAYEFIRPLGPDQLRAARSASRVVWGSFTAPTDASARGIGRASPQQQPAGNASLDFPEPVIVPWPRWARAAFALGAAGGLWALIFAAAH